MAFAATCPKIADEPEANEDCFVFSELGPRLALCDGASESYNSQLWAKLVCDKFAADPRFGIEWVDLLVSTYADAHDFESLSWSKQAAFERGSFSTLLGVDYDAEHDAVDVLAIGDTIALLVDEGRLVEAWPFSDPALFDRNPTLLATLPAHNDFVAELGFYERSLRTIHLREHCEPRLYCMTDALAKWALEMTLAGEAALEQLARLSSQDELCDLVTAERAAGRMKVDDSTLVIIAFDKPGIADGLSNA